MARRGSFGRSGTSQNLTMLVYQIMKQQMTDELDAILTAYKTNMESGMYDSQFNGQNVDGDFVINYYKNMLAGFPSGSTEYESINSKLEAFESSYQRDIQNLVINSMNSGKKIDFGLLGSGFSNKGIAEVELSDVRSWATDRVAQLLADGDTTAADELSGAVYVAGFNVDNDGKEAAVTSKEMSWSSYSKWLKGQLGAALDAGLTKSSEAYRSIMKKYASAVESATIDGQNRQLESIQSTIRNEMSDIDQVAQLLLQKYADSGDAVYIQAINDAAANIPEGSYAPYFSILQALAANKQDGGLAYTSIINQAGLGDGASLLAEAVSDTNSKMNDLLNGKGLAGLDPEAAISIRAQLVKMLGSNNAFISDSGISFYAGAGKSAIESFERGLRVAGVSQDPNSENGMNTYAGGHPDAVQSALKGLGEDITTAGLGKEYSWITGLANGYITTSFDPEGLAVFDKNKDTRITQDEIFAILRENNVTSSNYDAIMKPIFDQAKFFDVPTGKASSASLIQLYTDSVYNRYKVEVKGSKYIVNPAGTVMTSEIGQNDYPGYMPVSINVNGNQVFALVEPVKLKETPEGGVEGDLTPGKVGGMDITVFRYPGNMGNPENIGNMDSSVLITGNFQGANGGKRTMRMDFDEFVRLAKYAGIAIDAASFTDPQPGEPSKIIVRTTNDTMSDGQKTEFWSKVLTDPSYDKYITKLVNDNGIPVSTKPIGTDYSYRGTLNGGVENDATVNQLFSSGRESIIASAKDIAALRGDGSGVTKSDIFSALFSKVPQLTGGVQGLSIRDTIVNSDKFQATLKIMFPEIKDTKVGDAKYYNISGLPNMLDLDLFAPKDTPLDFGKGPSGMISPPAGRDSWFLEGAFRKAPVAMKPATPAAPKPVITGAAPTVKPTTSLTAVKPSTLSTTTAKAKITPFASTKPVLGPSSGYRVK